MDFNWILLVIGVVYKCVVSYLASANLGRVEAKSPKYTKTVTQNYKLLVLNLYNQEVPAKLQHFTNLTINDKTKTSKKTALSKNDIDTKLVSAISLTP